MKSNQFNEMVKVLKESKTLKVKDLEQCTINQLIKIEDVMLDMHLDKNLEKVLDIVTDMVMSATAKVTNKKEDIKKEDSKKEDIKKEDSKKTVKKAPNKNDKKANDEPIGLDYKSLKLGDIITIFNDSILDTHTTIIFKSNTMVVAVDMEDEVSYEFKKEFIEDGGYVFKTKKYFLRLGK